MKTRSLLFATLTTAMGISALWPSIASANASAVCRANGDVEVMLTNFVPDRDKTATVTVNGVTQNLRFSGASYETTFAGPFVAPWAGTVTWMGVKAPVTVTVSGPACADNTYQPVPEPPVPTNPVTPPTVTMTPPPVMQPPIMIPPVGVPPKPAIKRRWKPIACNVNRKWGRKPNGVVYSCRKPKPRIPAVTG